MKKIAIFTLLLLCLLSVLAFSASASYYESYEAEESSSIGTYALISLGVGLLAAIIVTAIMRRQLKSVRPQKNAGSYIIPGSYKLNFRRDIFLYSTISRTPKPKNDSKGKRH